MDILKILSIAGGGALGAAARHLINVSPLSNLLQPFPLPTFFINVAGSFLIGFFLVLFADKLAVGENIRAAVIVGFLGAFTTFSTFEAEIYELSKGKDFLVAAAYPVLSVVVGFIGVLSGVWLAKKI